VLAHPARRCFHTTVHRCSGGLSRPIFRRRALCSSVEKFSQKVERQVDFVFEDRSACGTVDADGVPASSTSGTPVPSSSLMCTSTSWPAMSASRACQVASSTPAIIWTSSAHGALTSSGRTPCDPIAIQLGSMEKRAVNRKIP
jgi:hypothetical protein